jgi:hypothetical protein
MLLPERLRGGRRRFLEMLAGCFRVAHLPLDYGEVVEVGGHGRVAVSEGLPVDGEGRLQVETGAFHLAEIP